MNDVLTLMGPSEEWTKILISGALNIVESLCGEEPLVDDLLIYLLKLWLLLVLHTVKSVENHSIFVLYLYLKTYFKDIFRLNIPFFQHVNHFIFKELLLSMAISLKIKEQLKKLLRFLERTHIS